MSHPLDPDASAAVPTSGTQKGPGKHREALGASLEYTAPLRRDLPGLLKKYNVGLLLDAASGRFSWMSQLDLDGVYYLGMDKAPEVVASNQQAYGGRHRRFLTGDIITAPLPPADMVLCREFLNSLPYSQIHAFLSNYMKSEIPFILLTSHRIWHNRDATTLKWRQLNLLRPPFSLPDPLQILEDSIEGHPSRYLGLWSMQQIHEILQRAHLNFGGEEVTSMNSPQKSGTIPMFKPFPKISAEHIASPQVDLVTVVYGPEISLLQLQARSFGRNLDAKNVRNIHIIINELEPASAFEKISEFVDAEYGALRDRVKIWTASEISEVDSSRGWRTQQTLKLRIADRIESKKYIVFDAKNHLIKKCSVQDFLASDGRPRSFWTVQAGSLKNYLINSLAYFGIPSDISTTKVMPATTPFVLYTDAVKNMMAMIEALEKTSFEKFFHSPGRDVTEFFLYFAYLVHQKEDFEKIYKFGGRFAVTLFTRWPDTAEQQEKALERLADPGIFVFGLHKNRVSALDDSARATVRKAWVDADLFADDLTAQNFYERILEDISADSGKQPLGS